MACLSEPPVSEMHVLKQSCMNHRSLHASYYYIYKKTSTVQIRRSISTTLDISYNHHKQIQQKKYKHIFQNSHHSVPKLLTIFYTSQPLLGENVPLLHTFTNPGLTSRKDMSRLATLPAHMIRWQQSSTRSLFNFINSFYKLTNRTESRSSNWLSSIAFELSASVTIIDLK